MKMEGGTSLVGIFGNTVREERFPTIIEEWFENKGSVFTIDEYKAYKKACETREGERSRRRITHCKKIARKKSMKSNAAVPGKYQRLAIRITSQKNARLVY
jgi:hypothetical protein